VSKELLLSGLVVAGPDQPVRPRRPPCRATHPDLSRFDTPDLILEGLSGQTQHTPLLGAKRRTDTHDLFGISAFATLLRMPPIATRCQAGEVPRHFADEGPIAVIQATQKRRTLAIALIKRQPVQLDAVARSPIDFFQSDLPFGSIDNRVRNAGFPAAGTVVGPGLGQKQLGIDQGLEAALRQTQVNGDDAIVHLADTAKVLPLHAGSFTALLAGTCFIDQANDAELVGR
jgi:hypothetical protein